MSGSLHGKAVGPRQLLSWLPINQLRQSNTFAARAYLVGRHGRQRATRVVRERLDDVLLVLIAVAIALVIRGVPRHQVIGGLENAGWAAMTVALYLPLVFLVGVAGAVRSLRGWDVSHEPLVQSVKLYLWPGVRVPGPWLARCVVHCSDGSHHETIVPPLGEISCVYNASFRSTGIHPPHGDHVAHWYIKEIPEDGWIAVGEDRFTYAPGHHGRYIRDDFS